MNPRRRAERGFTMTEMMIVVAIISVLVGMAIVYVKPKVKPIDVANRVGDMVREANRRAIALGPVRANVAQAVPSKKARTRVTATAGLQPTFTLWRLEEDPNPTIANGAWMPIVSYVVDRNVKADSFGPDVGSRASLPIDTDFSNFSVLCYPDGSCEPRSLFFEQVDPTSVAERQARMSIMPLGGAIMTRRDWN